MAPGHDLTPPPHTHTQDLQAQLRDQILPNLPRLQPSKQGIDVLELTSRHGWFFNPEPPEDDALLRNLITPAQFTAMVRRMNDAHVKKAATWKPDIDLPARMLGGREAVEAVAHKLNVSGGMPAGSTWGTQTGDVDVWVRSSDPHEQATM